MIDSAQLYRPSEWPGGLRCDECRRLFFPGDPVSERFEGLNADGDMPIVVVVCVPCALGVSW